MTKAILCSLFTASLFAQTSQQLTITLSGQSMIRSDLRQTAPAALPIIKDLLKGDVIFTNFEAAVAEPGESTREGRGFLSPPEALDALQSFGVNLLSLSGNHAFDLKVTGIENTLRETDKRGIVHAGTGKTLADASAAAYLKTPKGTIALVASASGLIAKGGMAGASNPGVNELRLTAGGKPNEADVDLPGAPANVANPEDQQRILNSIREAKNKSDLVIVYQHNHVFGNLSFSTMFTEGMDERLAPAAWLRNWVHNEVDAGADIVVMHGAPVLHGIEIYRGKPIFYDLGNFIYNLPPWLAYIHEPMSFESAVVNLRYSGKQLQAISLRPIVMNWVGQGPAEMHDEYVNNLFLQTRGLPSPAPAPRAGYILQRLQKLSSPFGTTIEIKGDTGEISVN